MINMIFQGGIYFLTLPNDGKLRPYVVISKNNGYGLNVLAFPISSKYADSKAALPVLISGKISFMRVSGVTEIPAKDIINANFKGIISNEILSYGMYLFVSRFMNIVSEEIYSKIDSYLNLLENENYYLHDGKVKFNANKFKNNTLIPIFKNKTEKLRNYNYPYDIKKWSSSKLKKFRTDMFRLTQNELMKKYKSSPERITYLKSHVKKELKKRKG